MVNGCTYLSLNSESNRCSQLFKIFLFEFTPHLLAILYLQYLHSSHTFVHGMNGFKNSLGQVLWQAFDVICGNLICLILRITTITAILFLLSLARGDSSLSDCYITQILSGAPAPPIIQFTCLCSYYSVFPPNKIYIFLLFKDTIKTTSSKSICDLCECQLSYICTNTWKQSWEALKKLPRMRHLPIREGGG